MRSAKRLQSNRTRLVRKSEVHDIYAILLAKGYDKKAAAKEAQARTGLSLVTGWPIMKKKGEFYG